MQEPGAGEPSQVVYQAAFETLIRAVQADEQPELVAGLAACGYDVRRPRREYPPATLRACLDLLTERCFPDRPLAVGHEEFGRRAFTAYRSTLVGRVITAALPMMGVPQALQMATRSFKSVSNYARFTVVPTGDHALCFQAEGSVLTPAYTLGLMKGLLAACGHLDATIRIDARQGPDRVDYHVTW